MDLNVVFLNNDFEIKWGGGHAFEIKMGVIGYMSEMKKGPNEY